MAAAGMPSLNPTARLVLASSAETAPSAHITSHGHLSTLPTQVLVLMLQKLYALGAGRIEPDNPDSLVHQEVLLPGQLWCMLFKERLLHLLDTLRQQVEREYSSRDEIAVLPAVHDSKSFRNALDRIGHASDIGKALEYFLATGNLVSESGLDLQQTSGFTIVAERLNYWR
jgi:DNA-directed RNA polymerase I subunit RPA2